MSQVKCLGIELPMRKQKASKQKQQQWKPYRGEARGWVEKRKRIPPFYQAPALVVLNVKHVTCIPNLKLINHNCTKPHLFIVYSTFIARRLMAGGDTSEPIGVDVDCTWVSKTPGSFVNLWRGSCFLFQFNVVSL
jgi:hypothetical protein